MQHWVQGMVCLQPLFSNPQIQLTLGLTADWRDLCAAPLDELRTGGAEPARGPAELAAMNLVIFNEYCYLQPQLASPQSFATSQPKNVFGIHTWIM